MGYGTDICLANCHLFPMLGRYEESETGFNIFGCDFMIDAQGAAWLIEINKTPGYKGEEKV